MVYFNTNKTQSFFFFQNTSGIKKAQFIFGGGGGSVPTLHSSPWSDPPLAHPAKLRTGGTVQNINKQFAIYCHVQHLHFCFEVFSYCKKHFFKCPLSVFREISFLKKSRITENQQKTRGMLVIYLGKPKILVEKSNGSHNSVWKSSENMGCDFGR